MQNDGLYVLARYAKKSVRISISQNGLQVEYLSKFETKTENTFGWLIIYQEITWVLYTKAVKTKNHMQVYL
jgi:hypothetical protein